MADRRLQVFCAVAKQKSFTKAAEHLFMTQPAVTFQIRQLEEECHMRLLERNQAGTSITPAGELVLEFAEKIIGLSSEMDLRVAEITKEIEGSLTVGASTTIAKFMLPRILGEFKAKYPQVKPRLVVGNSQAIEAGVAERTLSLGLIESPPHIQNLRMTKCCDDELRVICSPNFPLARHHELKPQQLAGHPYVSREPGSGTREYTDNYLREAGVDPESMSQVMELGSSGALIEVVEMGLGFAIASRAAVIQALRMGDLVAIPLRPKLLRTLYMVYSDDKYRPRQVSTFADFAALKLREFYSGWL